MANMARLGLAQETCKGRNMRRHVRGLVVDGAKNRQGVPGQDDDPRVRQGPPEERQDPRIARRRVKEDGGVGAGGGPLVKRVTVGAARADVILFRAWELFDKEAL